MQCDTVTTLYHTVTFKFFNIMMTKKLMAKAVSAVMAENCNLNSTIRSLREVANSETTDKDVAGLLRGICDAFGIKGQLSKAERQEVRYNILSHIPFMFGGAPVKLVRVYKDVAAYKVVAISWIEAILSIDLETLNTEPTQVKLDVANAVRLYTESGANIDGETLKAYKDADIKAAAEAAARKLQRARELVKEADAKAKAKADAKDKADAAAKAAAKAKAKADAKDKADAAAKAAAKAKAEAEAKAKAK